MIKIINEGIFSYIADSLGLGNFWAVIKGRFWRMIRTWTGIADVWKAESEEEIEKAYKEYSSDIEQIKAKYRQVETAWNEEISSQMGDHLLFMNPALALTSAIVQPLMDPTYRQDVRSLMQDTGIDRWGLTPDFISNWISDDPRGRQTQTATIKSTDPTTGKVTSQDIFVYEPNKKDKVNQITSLFLAENYGTKKPRLYENKTISKKEAQAMAVNISKAYEEEGIFDEMIKIGEEIKKRKEIMVADVVVPSTRTIKLMSDLIASETPEEFVQIMSEISDINPALKDLNPGNFISEIENTVQQINSDPNLKDKVSKESSVEVLDDAVLKSMIFQSARNKFAESILDSLDTLYEKSISVLMDGITEKGLKLIKSTDVGKEYASLIETNIQNLENAIISLDRLSKKIGDLTKEI